MVGYTIASRPCMIYMQYDNYVKLYEHKEDEEDEEEEEHLALADPSAILTGRRHLIPNPKPRSRDTSLVALGKSAIKFARQKSYADVRRKPVKFQVDNLVMLEMLEQVESIAYKLGLPQELSRVHNTFHISNLRKYYADEPLAIPLDELHFDDKLRFVEKPAEIMDREVKQLRQSRVPIVKVRWNSRRGPEFT
ncbi:hypothetical protein Tco_0122424 [Tanacetum coccineum]